MGVIFVVRAPGIFILPVSAGAGQMEEKTQLSLDRTTARSLKYTHILLSDTWTLWKKSLSFEAYALRALVAKRKSFPPRPLSESLRT